ncbi:MAG: PA0069 family radical SAM protein [Gammaproteobacteria bacterium]|nr:PA0069 family radical SAM protein [Gammaproteobacteria bacterium]
MNEHKSVKGRGAVENPSSRYLNSETVPIDDGWDSDPNWEPEFLASAPATQFFPDKTKKLITTNQSPDVPFEQSINPYKGCEHGCVYCFARPTHAYLDLSPGLDFETKIFFKTNPVERLREALEHPKYQCKTIAMGTNTDPYQPVEKEKRITRQILETLLEYRHPVSLVTKSVMIMRDLDLLQEFAKQDLVNVAISITTLNQELKTKLEPRCASPNARLRTLQNLASANIPVGVMVAPIIPMLNDHELESIVVASVEAGAEFAGYVIVRLPLEVAPLFEAWLEEHYPLKSNRIMNRIRDLRGGSTYQSEWGVRMRGTGTYAEMIAKRFNIVKRKSGLPTRSKSEYNDSTQKEAGAKDSDFVNTGESTRLRTDLFKPPDDYLPLFQT